MRRFDLYSRALPQALRVALALWFALLCASVPAEALVPPQAATMGGAAHLAGSLIDLNFAKGKFYLKGAAGPLTNSRSTPSWCLTSAGALVAAAVSQNCITDLGVASFEQRTNSIRNNTMVGAVVGTPGTLPTNWTDFGGTLNGITRTVVGFGTVNGIAYIDLNYAGTATSGSSFFLEPDVSGAIAASYGQTVTATFFATTPMMRSIAPTRSATSASSARSPGPP